MCGPTDKTPDWKIIYLLPRSPDPSPYFLLGSWWGLVSTFLLALHCTSRPANKQLATDSQATTMLLPPHNGETARMKGQQSCLVSADSLGRILEFVHIWISASTNNLEYYGVDQLFHRGKGKLDTNRGNYPQT